MLKDALHLEDLPNSFQTAVSILHKFPRYPTFDTRTPKAVWYGMAFDKNFGREERITKAIGTLNVQCVTIVKSEVDFISLGASIFDLIARVGGDKVNANSFDLIYDGYRGIYDVEATTATLIILRRKIFRHII